MVRKFPTGNCRTSEKRTTQPKIPEFPEENQMERKFLETFSELSGLVYTSPGCQQQ